MNSILRTIQKTPNDRGLLYKLESYIKKNWTFFSPEKPFNSLVFNEVFSELLVKIESGEIKKPVDVNRFFKSCYRKNYDSMNDTLKLVDLSSEVEVIKHSKLVFKDFSPSDYLLLFKYMTDPSISKDEKLIRVLTKLKLNSDVTDQSLVTVIGKCNFVALFLIQEMGFKKYVEFSELVDHLGIYYPLGQLQDSELVLNIKDRLLNKFMDSIQHANLDSLKTIEKLIF